MTKVERIVGSKDAIVVAYCASRDCHTSTKAVEKPEAEGFTNVLNYKGGAKEWLA